MLPTDLSTLNSKQADIVALTACLARHLILLKWKSAPPPSISTWLTDAMFPLKPKKVKFSLRGLNDTFVPKYQPFIIIPLRPAEASCR